MTLAGVDPRYFVLGQESAHITNRFQKGRINTRSMEQNWTVWNELATGALFKCNEPSTASNQGPCGRPRRRPSLRYARVVAEIALQRVSAALSTNAMQQRRGLLPSYVAAQDLAVIWGTGSSQDDNDILAARSCNTVCQNRSLLRVGALRGARSLRRAGAGSANPARLQSRAGLNVSSTRSTIGSKMCR